MLNTDHPHFRRLTEREQAEARILADMAADPREVNAFVRWASLPTFDPERIRFDECKWEECENVDYQVSLN